MSALSTNELLARVGIFANLTPDSLQAVASQVRKVRYARGDILLQEGGRTNVLIVLVTGTATVLRRDANNKEIHLATLPAGEFVGEMSLLDGQPHSATVRADTTLDALVLRREDFIAQLPSRATLAYEVMQELVARLRTANDKIQQLALSGLAARVRNELLSMSAQYPRGRVIERRIDKPAIAKRVAGSREAVSRIIREMFEAGELIEEPGGSVFMAPPKEEGPPGGGGPSGEEESE
jgi:CRP/FNR family transcriptional regulator, cyclic AMP receptor protein